VDWTALLVSYGVFLAALSVHECAHALVARWLGDDTGYALGRVTLNPIPHMDLVGTVALPLLMLYQMPNQGVFGWAKPVPYQPFRLRNPFLGSAAIAAAGPVSNLLFALVASLALTLTSGSGVAASLGHEILFKLVKINVILGLFNLIPLPPLDGGTIVGGLLPRRAAAVWGRMDTIGPVLFFVLLATGHLGRILWPVIDVVQRFVLELPRGLRG
jgi:Zn-dependent protease